MPAEIGQLAPDFTLRDTERNKVSLEALKGRKTLVVFIPFPFTAVCHGELCSLRDDLSELDANVVAITCDTLFSNGHWSEHEKFGFPLLSDYWPHGEVASAYGCFDERVGAARRYTYVLDKNAVVREVISSDDFGVAREHDRYAEALAKI